MKEIITWVACQQFEVALGERVSFEKIRNHVGIGHDHSGSGFTDGKRPGAEAANDLHKSLRAFGIRLGISFQ